MMYRLHKAGKMIRRATSTFTDIAAATGFSNHAHMSAMFRSWIGFTPSELRAPARHGLPDIIQLLTP